MLTDQHGNALSGATVEAVRHFDQAVTAFNLYRGDPVAMADAAIEAAPTFVMAHILKAYLFALATEPDAAAEARAIVNNVRTMRMCDRERSHVVALDELVSNNWSAAGTLLDRHTMRYAHDMVAIQAGHLIDFYRANARDLRDRIARVLPRWSRTMPGYSILLGMYAFGLEESGNYAKAEDVGREACAMQPLDAWAHHAIAHVMEMQGRAQDGVGWMTTREEHWSGDDNFFQVHNWWHKALFHLDLGDHDAVMSLYDGPIREAKSNVALDMVDASALLWRTHTAGVDVGDRWNELSMAWDQHADGKLYPFNDWHAAMAYLGAGRDEEVERIVKAYRKAQAENGEVGMWARQTGLPLIEGFSAFWHGKYETAVEKLLGARQIANTFGGSHAQRDVIDWTLTEAAIRGGMPNVAEGMANERVALKPHSPVNRQFLDRARNMAANRAMAA